jgi:hypothetical protein
MNITLLLDAEVERRLREEAANKGLAVEEFLAQLAERAVAPAPPSAVLSGEAWETAWRAWAASHKPVTRPVDDDRDSIYAGRGE